MQLKKTLAVATVGIALCGMAWGQTVTGNISGQVTDPSGAIVVGAQVTATNVATRVSNSALTNKDGIYSIRFLQVGQYTLSFQASGFSMAVTPAITLEVAQDAKVDMALK